MSMPEEFNDWLKQATEYVKSTFPKGEGAGGDGDGTPPPPPKKEGEGDGAPPPPPKKKHFWFGELSDD